MSEVWGLHTFPSNLCRKLSCGPLQVWLHRKGDEWSICHAYTTGDSVFEFEASAPPKSTDWSRWLVPACEAVAIIPQLPDLPVIVRPDKPLFVSPGATVQFWVRLPIWVRFQFGKNTYHELPALRLSQSWFGDPTEGMACYSLRTTARRDLGSIPAVPYRALCGIEIQNRADEPLDFQRLCLSTRQLAVFPGKTHLETNPVRTTHHGDSERTFIEILEHKPITPPLAEAREPQTRFSHHMNVFRRFQW